MEKVLNSLIHFTATARVGGFIGIGCCPRLFGPSHSAVFQCDLKKLAVKNSYAIQDEILHKQIVSVP